MPVSKTKRKPRSKNTTCRQTMKGSGNLFSFGKSSAEAQPTLELKKGFMGFGGQKITSSNQNALNALKTSLEGKKQNAIHNIGVRSVTAPGTVYSDPKISAAARKQYYKREEKKKSIQQSPLSNYIQEGQHITSASGNKFQIVKKSSGKYELVKAQNTDV